MSLNTFKRNYTNSDTNARHAQMEGHHPFQRWSVALIFATFITPLYFVCWWINAQALALSNAVTPKVQYYAANWYLPLIMDRLNIVLSWGLIFLAATTTVLIITHQKHFRSWSLLMGLWFWLAGCGSTFIISPLRDIARNWVFWDSLDNLFAYIFVAGLAGIIPCIVGLFVSFIWLLIALIFVRPRI
jgi:hypothetical protein